MTDAEFKLISTRFDTIEKLLAGVNTRLDGINGKVNKHEGQIQEALGERAQNRKVQDEKFEKVSELETRVNLVEKAELTHIINCPINPKIRALEDNMLSQQSIKKWVAAAIAITGTVVGIVVTILNFIMKAN